MTVSNVSFFFSEGKNKQPPDNQVFLRYMPLEEIQCFRKKKKLIELLTLLEEDHDLPGLNSERDQEMIMAAAEKIIEQKRTP